MCFWSRCRHSGVFASVPTDKRPHMKFSTVNVEALFRQEFFPAILLSTPRRRAVACRSEHSCDWHRCVPNTVSGLLACLSAIAAIPTACCNWSYSAVKKRHSTARDGRLGGLHRRTHNDSISRIAVKTRGIIAGCCGSKPQPLRWHLSCGMDGRTPPGCTHEIMERCS